MYPEKVQQKVKKVEDAAGQPGLTERMQEAKDGGKP